MTSEVVSLLKTGEVLLRVASVQDMTGLSRAYLYKLMSEGNFPRPLRIGRRAVWPASAVQRWIQHRIDFAVAEAAARERPAVQLP